MPLVSCFLYTKFCTFISTRKPENRNDKGESEKIIMEILLLLILVAVWAINKADINRKLDNYDMSKVDNSKLSWDTANGVSVAERRRRLVNGYYDKDRK